MMENQIVNAVTHKKPVPEIDFTLHRMEDGTQVSTMERVCKGIFLYSGRRDMIQVCILTFYRGAGTRAHNSL